MCTITELLKSKASRDRLKNELNIDTGKIVIANVEITISHNNIKY